MPEVFWGNDLGIDIIMAWWVCEFGGGLRFVVDFYYPGKLVNGGEIWETERNPESR